MTTELTCSLSLDQSSALITRCHPMKQARCGPICANVDGTARRRKRSPGIRCRIENCVQSFTAVFDLSRSRDRTFIAMVAEYCGHSLSIRTAEIADYCESDVRRLASKFPQLERSADGGDLLRDRRRHAPGHDQNDAEAKDQAGEKCRGHQNNAAAARCHVGCLCLPRAFTSRRRSLRRS